jgi:hypothetical protein
LPCTLKTVTWAGGRRSRFRSTSDTSERPPFVAIFESAHIAGPVAKGGIERLPDGGYEAMKGSRSNGATRPPDDAWVICTLDEVDPAFPTTIRMFGPRS